MPNKPNMAKLVKSHEDAQRAIRDYWVAHYNQTNPVDMKRTSALTLVAVAQAWEKFRSDWQIRAIVRDDSTYRSNFLPRIPNAIPTDLKAAHLAGRFSVRVTLPQHLNIRDVELLLDARDRNVTYADRAEEKKHAGKELSGAYLTKVLSRSDDDWLILDLVKRLRNAIAHGSGESVTNMNTAIANMGTSTRPADTALQKGIVSVSPNGIGAYLFASLPTHNTARVVHLLDRVIEIGNKL